MLRNGKQMKGAKAPSRRILNSKKPPVVYPPMVNSITSKQLAKKASIKGVKEGMMQMFGYGRGLPMAEDSVINSGTSAGVRKEWETRRGVSDFMHKGDFHWNYGDCGLESMALAKRATDAGITGVTAVDSMVKTADGKTIPHSWVEHGGKIYDPTKSQFSGPVEYSPRGEYREVVPARKYIQRYFDDYGADALQFAKPFKPVQNSHRPEFALLNAVVTNWRFRLPEAAPAAETRPTGLPGAGNGLLANINEATGAGVDLAHQKEWGGMPYRVKFAGLDILIENPAGSTRSGIDANGKPWACVLPAHYGCIRRLDDSTQ